MRKWFYAGAVVGGFLLFGAAPAQADDVVPGPAGGLTGLLPAQGTGLDPAGGLSLPNPLGDAPLVDVKPGTNSADLNSLDVAPPGTAPADLPTDRTPATTVPAEELPAADVVGGALPQTSSVLPSNLLGGDLLGQLPLLGGLGGLTPDGRIPGAASQESGLFTGGLPLLGGLGGLLPANEIPSGAGALPAVNGLPAGGTDVTPSALAGQTADDPADDPRAHEEPADDEATPQRTFSAGGRPIAGRDRDF
ncbi:hypothetical protein [Actinoplanes sp. NPDC049681]|uniref:hypothetical protein n=1 Tax=Actinoplanes sp. NPDC049681 TaxID=3363905 RepID=UPI0037ABE441